MLCFPTLWTGNLVPGNDSMMHQTSGSGLASSRDLAARMFGFAMRDPNFIPATSAC